LGNLARALDLAGTTNPQWRDSLEDMQKKLVKANGQLQKLPEGDRRTKKEATIEFLKQAIADRQKAAAEQAAFEKKFPGVTNRYIQSELKTWTEGKANWKKIEGNGDPEDPLGNGVFRLDGTGKDMDGGYHDRFVLYKPQLENEVATRYERVARIETSPYNDEEFYPLTITKDNLYILNEDGMRGVAGPKIGIGEAPGLPNGPSPPGVPRRPPGPNPRRPLPATAPTAAGRRRKTRGRRVPRRKTSRRKQ
jgi:hypothetical protein